VRDDRSPFHSSLDMILRLGYHSQSSIATVMSMVRYPRVILPFVLVGLWEGLGPSTRPEPGLNVCTIPLTQVLRIPVSTLGTPETQGSVKAAAATLMVSPGATDELNEGPTGFDVLDDGAVLITDPLRKNVSHFDSHGGFRKAWRIGFSADSLTVTSTGAVLVREASTGKLYAFDRDGQTRSAEDIKEPEEAEARVLDGQNGTVKRPALDSGQGGPLVVQLNQPDMTLLSLVSLLTDQKGDTYVALETTARGRAADAIDVNKYVRRYSSSGKLLCEITDIPLDYYVPPVDELRVRQGRVYQLQTTSSEVRINMWDTNQLCAHSSP
jgi:hypothetical protein